MPNRLDYNWEYRISHKTLFAGTHFPVISNVSITISGLVTWITDVAATSQVLYGSTPNLGVITPHDPALVTNHSVQLTGLSSGALYYLKVQSFYVDSLAISDLYTFTYLSIATSFFLLEDGSSHMLLEDGASKLGLET